MYKWRLVQDCNIESLQEVLLEKPILKDLEVVIYIVYQF